MSDEKFDLSPLRLDEARSRRMTSSILAGAARGLAERRRRLAAPTVARQLAAWTRAVLAAAAVVCIASAPALLGRKPARSEAPRAPDLGSAALLWATDGRAPTIRELFDVVGGHHNDEAGE